MPATRPSLFTTAATSSPYALIVHCARPRPESPWPARFVADANPVGGGDDVVHLVRVRNTRGGVAAAKEENGRDERSLHTSSAKRTTTTSPRALRLRHCWTHRSKT